jgi:hypothetical protein
MGRISCCIKTKCFLFAVGLTKDRWWSPPLFYSTSGLLTVQVWGELAPADRDNALVRWVVPSGFFHYCGNEPWHLMRTDQMN